MQAEQGGEKVTTPPGPHSLRESIYILVELFILRKEGPAATFQGYKNLCLALWDLEMLPMLLKNWRTAHL